MNKLFYSALFVALFAISAQAIPSLSGLFTVACDPTLANVVAIFGNDLWSYAAPFVGGLMCIQVYSDYEAQKAGFQAAGISFCNFYNMIMGGMK